MDYSSNNAATENEDFSHLDQAHIEEGVRKVEEATKDNENGPGVTLDTAIEDLRYQGFTDEEISAVRQAVTKNLVTKIYELGFDHAVNAFINHDKTLDEVAESLREINFDEDIAQVILKDLADIDVKHIKEGIKQVHDNDNSDISTVIDGLRYYFTDEEIKVILSALKSGLDRENYEKGVKYAVEAITNEGKEPETVADELRSMGFKESEVNSIIETADHIIEEKPSATPHFILGAISLIIGIVATAISPDSIYIGLIGYGIFEIVRGIFKTAM